VSSIQDVTKKIEELKSVGILTEKEAECIEAEKIMAFFDSDAGRLIKEADNVYKEVMFAVNISAGDIDKNYSGDAKVMLQGIIDCVAVSGDIITIIDYKTDKAFSTNDIVAKYKIQLDLYSKAAAILYQKPVERKILYLFDKNKSIEV